MRQRFNGTAISMGGFRRDNVEQSWRIAARGMSQ
jgi:hypothetical protein